MSWLVFVVFTLAVVTVVSAGCSQPQWITYLGKKVASSTPHPAGNANVSTCQTQCLQQLSCVAVDYNNDVEECYLTSDANAPLVDDAAFTHYTAQRTCEANGTTCVYKSIGKYAFEGNIYNTTGASTIDDCVAGCTNSSCTAFAWEPFGEFRCIKTSEPVSNKVNTTIYTALQKAECSSSCPPSTSTAEADKVSTGNVRKSAGDQSAFACELQCLATDGCVAYDYKTTGPECYIQLNANAALSDEPGTNHYTISRPCYQPPHVDCSDPQWVE